MRKILSFLTSVVFGLSVCSSVSFSKESIDPMRLPYLEARVSDFAGVLSSSDKTSLESVSRDYEAKTSNQMVVVLIPNRNGGELFDIGMKIFKDNWIGQKGKNNGILLLVATEEKKIRIVTGYGMEADVPDVLARDFIEKDIRPLVNEGKYAEAIRTFFNRTMKAVGTDEGAKLQKQADQEGIVITSIMAIIFGLVFSFNLFFLLFAGVFFLIASLSIGSIYPILGFLMGMILTLFVGFHFFDPGFRKTFFEMPKNRGGWGGGNWGSGGGSGGGWGFSGGGGSSWWGGAGD